MTAAPRRLESYLMGAWRRGAGEGQVLADAATGAPVAVIDATGLDMGSALAFAREVGGPALRRLSFHDRAAMLKALAVWLNERRDPLYAESYATGATKADGLIDIDGGIGTLFAYASKGRRELPATRVLLDGAPERLSKDDTFGAQHILTPLRGAAIHINAFNFPCWGMLEKIAPALLAGVPSIVKPASQTAYLTESLMRAIVASGLLPEGALQLVAGSVGDLLNHVTGQDVVTFTGSAATGRRLRSHPAVVANSTRFTMEADSLNAAILGPDAGPESPEFGLFLAEVAREMTVKAGQKCTAIRRVIVPVRHLDAVAAGLAERLDGTAVGLPADAGTRMGPLASLAQREEVRARIADLGTEAEVVTGDPACPRLASGDARAGGFLNPVLLACARPHAATAVHEVEAFGPVATLMPYDDDPEEAAALAAMGKGSLVASVFTDDAAVAEAVVLGLAPHNGRVMIGNRASAASSTGHGAPLPMLVHGGPGRAGGGEELGGLRGVTHYMQRTAVQGAPRLLSAVTGRWTEGAQTRAEVHPFRRPLKDLRIGDRIVTPARTVTPEDIAHFAAFTGDTFYAHVDEDAAKANPFFEGRVAHGYLVLSFAAGLFVDPAPGPVLANYGIDSLRFLTPVYPGDSLRVRLTAKEIRPRPAAGHGEVRWDARVTNQRDEVVAQYDLLTMVAKDWP